MLTELDPIFQTLEAHSGITVANAHREYMEKLILERTVDIEISPAQYNDLIKADDAELSYLTNAAAVNETYFFREERQFDFLKSDIFPKFRGRQLTVWSASCSTGEEPLSVYTLARHCGLSLSLMASDIDSDALDCFKAGLYTGNSFRTDGSKYRPLIEKLGSWENGKLRVSPQVVSCIRIFPYNLASPSQPPITDGSVDIIFMRNVFIYFTPEVRKRILAKIARSLKDDGIVILSVNEVGNIDKSGLPFDKLHSGSIYYLKKKSGNPEKKAAPLPRPAIQSAVSEASGSVRPLPPAPPRPAKTADGEKKSLSIRDLYESIDGCIGRKDLEAARKRLEGKAFKPHEMEFKYYFSALIHLESQEDELAAEELERAVTLNGSFWPARYRLALLQQKRGEEREGMKGFEACGRSIQEYRREGRTDYDFLIAQFSPEYVEMLCRNYLKGAEER